MRFWDTSALFASIADEAGSDAIITLLCEDPLLVIWWGTLVELASAAGRLKRVGSIDDDKMTELLEDATQLLSGAEEIQPSDDIRIAATRLLRLHELRAGDALQLAAAMIWTGHVPAGNEFVCMNARLRAAAEREGFTVLPAEM